VWRVPVALLVLSVSLQAWRAAALRAAQWTATAQWALAPASAVC
jgi:hypothetical protein